MNDRYLFKAKDYMTDEWIVGSLIMMDWDSGYVFIAEPYECASTMPVRELLRNQTLLVKKETLCQCTGLKDKNGMLIFENDIVCHKYYEDKERKQVGIVGFGDFNCSCCHGVYGWHFGDEDIRDVSSYAVIGNIFDNPELLEVE